MSSLFAPKVYTPVAAPDPSLAAMQRAAEQDKISGISKEVALDTDNLIRAFGVRNSLSSLASTPASAGSTASAMRKMGY